MQKTMLVGVTVTDLRAQPQKMQQLIYRHDPLELSQLVFNEYVNVLVPAKIFCLILLTI